MNNKGQIFSIDLLFAVILLIFAIGLLLGAAEINNYNQKQQNMNAELIQKTIIGAQVITNSSEWDCNLDNTHAAYSLNLDKFKSTSGNTIEKIKQKANLTDYNIKIVIGELTLYEENLLNLKNAISFDLNILTCTNSTNFNMLKNCMSTNYSCYSEIIKKEKFTLVVAK